MQTCLSGISIILIMMLLFIINQMTLNDLSLNNVILIGGILFYINQRYITGCSYPDYNL